MLGERSPVQVWRPLLLALVFPGLTGCTSVGGAGPGDASGWAHVEAYFDDILAQLRESWEERDLDRMESLLSVPRDASTARQKERFRVFQDLLAGLRIVERGFERCGFVLAQDPSTDRELGSALELALVLEPTTPNQGVISASGRDGSRSRLVLMTEVEDLLLNGSRVALKMPRTLSFRRDVRVSHGQPLRVPLPEPPGPGPEVLIRRLTYRGSLLPAAFEWNGAPVGVPRIHFSSLDLNLLPEGFQSVKDAPLARLGTAVREGHAADVLLACWFLERDGKADEKQQALPALIRMLRRSPPELEPTCRACLELMTGDEGPLSQDREGWLRWWALRESR